MGLHNAFLAISIHSGSQPILVGFWFVTTIYLAPTPGKNELYRNFSKIYWLKSPKVYIWMPHNILEMLKFVKK